MDEGKLDRFSERLLTDINSGMSCLNLYIGHRLGLFSAMQVLGKLKPNDLAINTSTNEVQWAGANNPLYIIRNQELEINNDCIKLYELPDISAKLYEFKPDKMPIAIYVKMNTFENKVVQLQKGDKIYMFSDGYVDQFGGPKGKKFKSRPFRQLLLENADKSMSEQKEILSKAFEDWKAEYEQIDDVVVLGIEI